ncbi:MAG: hypothetical protein EAX95_14065 [Candidatus Thorarchaeota archaeon]|nr:hypothetical protein [Candidatus Thorarchaeota archaeon]
MKGKTAIATLFLMVLFSSAFLVGLDSAAVPQRAIALENMNSSLAGMPAVDTSTRRTPVSILVYTEFTDPVPGSLNEFSNTMESIRNTYGYKFRYENLTDYTQLPSHLNSHDVLLIVEQEYGYVDNMTMVGEAWAPTLTSFVNGGGIVILMDYGNQDALGGTSYIYNASGLMTITGFYDRWGDPMDLHNSSDALARGVASSWTSPNGCVGYVTDDGTDVAGDGLSTIAVHKIMGSGHIVLLGFDFFNTEANCAQMLANSIRLHRHVVFDESHAQYYGILNNFGDFADDLVAEGFAVSRMTTFDEDYLAACEVLVLTTGTENFTTQEAAIVESFVLSGKGLFVATDYGPYGEELDPVTERFGFVRNKTSYLTDSDDTLYGDSYNMYNGDNIVNHSITLTATRLELDRPGAFASIPGNAVTLVTTDSDGTSTWAGDGSAADGVILAAAMATGGNGRVAVIMDMNFMDDSTNPDADGETTYHDSGNDVFLVNNIRWLGAAGLEEQVVVFDQSHGPNWTVGISLQYLIRLLTENGYTAKWMTEFYTTLIDYADILFIVDGSSNYTAGEMDAIELFVANGGGLYLTGAYGEFGEQTDYLANQFGLGLNTTGTLHDSDDYLGSLDYIVYNQSNFGNHPIMNGIARYESYIASSLSDIGAGTALVVTDSDDTCTWDGGGIANGVPIASALKYAKGRIYFCGDYVSLSGNIDADLDGVVNLFDADNPLLVLNVFYWLSENRAPIVEVTFPNGGEILNGTQIVTWTSVDYDGDPTTFDVYYSDNNGSDWTALATGLTAHQYSWNTTQHDDAYGYMIRIVASDGRLSSHDESDQPFELDNFAGTTTTTTGIPIDPMLLLIIAAVAGVVVIVIIIVVKRKK